MFMLYESMVWICLFRSSGIPVPRCGAVHAPHFFFNNQPKKQLMRKIKLYIAVSMDGYIADINGELDWLTDYPINKEFNYGYDNFYQSVDTVIMGGKTFRDILNMDVNYPYRDKHSYIISRTNGFPTTLKDINFISKDIMDSIFALKGKEGKDIWLVGGGQVLSLFMESKLVDEMILTYIPKILGDGIPLFPKMKNESKWKLTKSQSYINGVISIEYQKIN